ncbi:hypothetical protein [Veronia pacifica]|uniref:Uncharacterized protein n=1 Tax=Veronia pacifica TaxID=1080227 RepID=A0A1C3ESK6_9GAMM|nr:hypothetical protein [Veronia pacifica]ODA36198.1 hypothetical protein A8L45_00920 [Veronia pacifica]
MKTTLVGKPDYPLLDVAIEDFCLQRNLENSSDENNTDKQLFQLHIFSQTDNKAYRIIETTRHGEYASLTSFLMSLGYACLSSTKFGCYNEFHYHYKSFNSALIFSTNKTHTSGVK